MPVDREAHPLAALVAQERLLVGAAIGPGSICTTRVGADTIMLGSLLARTKESPGQEILLGGRVYKEYRGMGSIGALANESNDRYAKSAQGGAVVPEGIEGHIPLSGTA